MLHDPMLAYAALSSSSHAPSVVFDHVKSFVIIFASEPGRASNYQNMPGDDPAAVAPVTGAPFRRCPMPGQKKWPFIITKKEAGSWFLR
ncbi:hypothetical protein AVEN_261415-1 [Araneus ventricosus]|uniref:Uncharacterized protein n=1 Tax=Araneus ventricosus TaxID=182803 RepID=A0A4Y2VRC3_ARAVE|nr:hypothetical protein AVEN_261415-1 [Araneus ventricosus]